MKNEIKILIADDHPVFRKGLIQVVSSDAALNVVAEAEDGEKALELIEQHAPEVALLDVDMPKMDGIAVAQAVGEKNLPVEIVFLTMHKDEDVFNEAMDAGAKGFVLKESAVTDIIQSIRAVAAGEHFISPQLSSYLINRTRAAALLVRQKPNLQNLTQTERRVLKLIAENKTSREIADELFVSIRTIENHRANICAKLDLRGAYALLKFAIANRSTL